MEFPFHDVASFEAVTLIVLGQRLVKQISSSIIPFLKDVRLDETPA
jgi:hypothetical protein